jgi:DNA-directed RNA polymerase specialized sigma24 family protein
MDAARDAACAGDFAAMMEAIVDSHYLDAVYRYLGRDWSQFDHDDAATLVGAAVDEFYQRAKSGTKIWKPRSYLFKILQKLAIDEHERRKPLHEFEGPTEAEAARALQGDRDVLVNTVPRPERVRAAIQLARQLIPKVGERQLQQICEFYIDAVEKELPSVEDETLAETFGLQVDTARRLKNRALERLTREAKKAGIRITEIFGPDIFKKRAELDEEQETGREENQHE